MLLVSAEFWIGMSDLEQEGTFLWTDGTPAEYAHVNHNEDCVRLDGGELKDTRCTTKLPFICENWR